ncbi:MAG TPA: rhomboid family intramembrane serine protease [Pseudolysinimonas sp.]|nr:rhomboid family intramembrane serine protease [Pseudolysinimonas sp.]
MTEAETSPDVCYRHPKRESWVLCQRCGRTICPECQILAPVGVQCPECVREVGGSVTWRGAGEARRAPAKARPTRSRPQRSSTGAGWQGALGQMLRPGGDSPAITWGTIGIVIVLWIAGFVTGNLPFLWLAADPSVSIQIWRYITAPFVYPATFLAIVSILLNSLFFVLIVPAVERKMGRSQFLAVFAAAAVVGSAGMVLSGSTAYGLVGVLFGMFGAYLIFVWAHPPARTQALVVVGINLLISLAFGASLLPQLIGGLIAGAGATYLIQRYEDRPGSGPRTAYLIIGGVMAGFILLTILRTIAF